MSEAHNSKPEEEAPAAVAVGRTVGGLLLVIVGLALALGGAFVYFVTPWLAAWSDSDSIWSTLSDLDIVGAIVGGLGLVAFFLGGGLIQRARRKRFEWMVDAGGDTTAAMTIGRRTPEPAEKPADPTPPAQPTTIL